MLLVSLLTCMSLWHAYAESANEPQEIFKEELHLSELVNEDILADFRFTILANSSNSKKERVFHR